MSAVDPEIPPSPPRSIRLLRPPDRYGVGLLCIVKDHQTFYYVFKEIPCEIGGRGFAVHKLGMGTLYHVRLGTVEA